MQTFIKECQIHTIINDESSASNCTEQFPFLLNNDLNSGWLQQIIMGGGDPQQNRRFMLSKFVKKKVTLFEIYLIFLLFYFRIAEEGTHPF